MMTFFFARSTVAIVMMQKPINKKWNKTYNKIYILNKECPEQTSANNLNDLTRLKKPNTGQISNLVLKFPWLRELVIVFTPWFSSLFRIMTIALLQRQFLQHNQKRSNEEVKKIYFYHHLNIFPIFVVQHLCLSKVFVIVLALLLLPQYLQNYLNIMTWAMYGYISNTQK